MNTQVSLEIRSLMARFRQGDRDAVNRLVDHFYPELRRIAAARMRTESAEHTWSPTVLVSELYLELVKVKALRAPSEDSSEQEAFLSLAGHIMRRLLVHHARPLYRKAHKVESGALELVPLDNLKAGAESLLEVEELLERLSKIDPRFRTIVELRVFEGKTTEETAHTMGCSVRSVYTYWRFATHWLSKELGVGSADADCGSTGLR
jgi:RNA polymerase sigma factor (TIGR02999 family)